MLGDYSCSQITETAGRPMIDCSPGDRVRQFTPPSSHPPNISLLPLGPSNGNIPFESVCLGILWMTRRLTAFCFQCFYLIKLLYASA